MTDLTRRLPPLAALAPFEAAVRHRNFTRAAQELHMSQTTVSRRIRELEADLGISLFERHRYDVTPTADAEVLAASVRLALGELASTSDLIRRQHAERSLTIFSDLSLGATLVAPIIGDFQRQHPNLTIKVISSYEPIEKTRENIDIGFQYGRREATGFTVEPIADETVFPVCSPDFADQLPTPVEAAELTTYPLLHTVYDDPTWTDWSKFFAYHDIDQTASPDGMNFTSYQVCLDVAERGDGIALGWERSVQGRIAAGRLVRVSSAVMPHPNAINVYRPNSTVMNPYIDEFLALLKTALL